MRRVYFGIGLTLWCSTLILAGCGNGTAKQDIDYEQTKQMIVDVLQTDEGKKALQDVISDDKMKQHLVIEADVVKTTLTETLSSEKGKEMWKKLFQDPTFVEGFNKSIAEEQKKLFKSLMNDAEFQKQMLELMQDPEMTKETIKALKSQQFRAHLEETIQQTLNNPLYQAKIQELLLKAAEKQKKDGGEQGGGEQQKSEDGSQSPS